MDLMIVRYKQEMQIALQNIKYEDISNNNKLRRKTCPCMRSLAKYRLY